MSKIKSEKAEKSLPTFLQPVVPCDYSVEGAVVLTAICDTIRRFMVLPEHAAEAVALWVMFAHAHDAAEHSPILAIESPEKRCGKTTLLNIISKLVPVPFPAANITTAAIFRSIEKYKPTLLLDEVETFIRDKEEMRGVLNSGFTRESAIVVRTVGDAHDPQPFNTWCPKVGALIGKLPETLQDRAIVLVLRRSLPSEKPERFTRRHHNELHELRAKATRWAIDNIETLRDVEPSMPNGLGDRAEDAWRPLLAIADLAGGPWPGLARKAALYLSGVPADETDGASKGVLLLMHIREIFNDKRIASIASQQLLEVLNDNEEWPWGEWRQGKPITARGVANILKPYGIRPARGRGGSSYAAKDFKDAWQRYATAPTISEHSTSATSATDAEIPRPDLDLAVPNPRFQAATEGLPLQFAKSLKAIENSSVFADVALGKGKTGNQHSSNGIAHHDTGDDVELF